MAGNALPNGIIGAEVIASNISGVGDYNTNPLALFDGLYTGGAYPFGMFYWANPGEYMQFTIKLTANIWRAPSPNYLGYQAGQCTIYKLKSDGITWENVNATYPQTVVTLANGQWGKYVSGLPPGTYKFVGTSTIRIDGEWYMEETFEERPPKNFNGQIADDVLFADTAKLVSGINCDEVFVSDKKIHLIAGHPIDLINIGVIDHSIKLGKAIEIVEIGTIIHRNILALGTDNPVMGKRVSNRNAINIEDLSTGKLSTTKLGILIDDVAQKGIKVRNYIGLNVDPVTPSTNAKNKFKLVVTPTHQYRNQVVNVHCDASYLKSAIGKYQLTIGNIIPIPYSEVDSDLMHIDFNILPSQLKEGVNHCRIDIRYKEGLQEYLDFEVFKENVKRLTVERTFRDYDGGYDGSRLDTVYSFLPTKYPCISVPDGATGTLIKTTDYTNIPLVRYNALQGVHIDAAGARVLISFNKGVTWEALISNVWQPVAISNIETLGMTTETVNSIVLARWGELFKPSSIDFAIYLKNSESNAVPNPTLLYALGPGVGFSKGTYTYTPPPNTLITNVNYRLSGTIISGAFADHGVYYSNYSEYIGAVRTHYTNDYRLFSENRDFVDATLGTSPTSIVIGACYRMSYSDNSTKWVYVYGGSAKAYLKSITADITPNLKTGYAFII